MAMIVNIANHLDAAWRDLEERLARIVLHASFLGDVANDLEQDEFDVVDDELFALEQEFIRTPAVSPLALALKAEVITDEFNGTACRGFARCGPQEVWNASAGAWERFTEKDEA
jgi:hypothetical protein